MGVFDRSQNAESIARRWGLNEDELTEECVEALAHELRTLPGDSREWVRGFGILRRRSPRPLSLEAVHGQRRDKEFKTLSKIVLGNNPATRQAATLTFQYMHNKAHDR